MQFHFLQELRDESIEKALAFLVEAGAINTVFLATQHDYLVSSGFDRLYHNRERDEHTVDGFFYDYTSTLYRDSEYEPVRCDHCNPHGKDIFATVSEASNRTGMNTYGMILNRWPQAELYPQFHMRSINGQMIPKVFCANNPQVRALYKAVIQDTLQRYELTGIFLALLDHYVQFGFEHLTDELAYSLGTRKFATPEVGLSCFCEHCCALAAERGIDVDRVRNGLLRGVARGWIPHNVELLRDSAEVFNFLVEVPEFLEWMRFRAHTFVELHTELFNWAKSIRPDCQVALNTYGPADCWKYAANYEMLASCCDWIKPMFYSGTYPGLPRTPDQIGDQTRDAVQKANGRPVVSGINGIGSKATEESITVSFDHTIKAGASGVILSWDYALIPLRHIEVFGGLWRNTFS
jgi:hypothetical protein